MRHQAHIEQEWRDNPIKANHKEEEQLHPTMDAICDTLVESGKLMLVLGCFLMFYIKFWY